MAPEGSRVCLRALSAVRPVVLEETAPLAPCRYAPRRAPSALLTWRLLSWCALQAQHAAARARLRAGPWCARAARRLLSRGRAARRRPRAARRAPRAAARGQARVASRRAAASCARPHCVFPPPHVAEQRRGNARAPRVRRCGCAGADPRSGRLEHRRPRGQAGRPRGASLPQRMRHATLFPADSVPFPAA
jgi:hypothetical protein